VGCSLLAWRSVSNADLCEQVLGHEVYLLAASLSLAWLIASKRWGRRDG
jgi:hypothetical protein